MNNLPKIDSIWSHHTNGGEYVVYDITNENTQNEKYPINISYRGANGRKWSKPLDNFLRTMVESEARLPCGHPVADDYAHNDPNPGATHFCVSCEKENEE